MPLLIKPPPSDEPPRYIQGPTGQWIIAAPKRMARPAAGLASDLIPHAIEGCPFCEGAETRTPPEVFAFRTSGQANQKGWTVRVVPNLYPIVSPQGAETIGNVTDGVHLGYGRHEVVIERPDHAAGTAGLSDRHMRDIFISYRSRLLALGRDPKIVYGLVFKNTGRTAGASQEHVHSQILGLAILPPAVEQVLSTPTEVATLSADDPRVIARGERIIAFCPEPSMFPLEVWLAPLHADPDYRNADDAELLELGRLARDLLDGLSRMIEPVAFNYYLHTAAFDQVARPMERWVWKIVPRLEGLAGCEIGAGIFINPLRPQWAAEQYRHVIVVR